MSYTALQMFDKLEKAGYHCCHWSNIKHGYRKGDYLVVVMHASLWGDNPGDDKFPHVEIYRNDTLICASYIIKNHNWSKAMIPVVLTPDELLNIAVNFSDNIFNIIMERYVDMTLEKLDEKPQVKS